MFCGMCIVICSERTESDSLEYIAEVSFGKLIGKLASYSTMMCLMGYVTSYIVVVKTLVPYIIKRFMENNLPLFFENKISVQIMIATFYSLFFLLPLSLPRKMGALRFTSLFGFAWCIFLVVVIWLIFILGREVVPDPIKNLEDADYINISFSGIFSTFPFIISSYMYQPMIPAIYKNLENRNMKRMEKVLLYGSSGAVFLYILISVFGYLTFVNNSEQLEILHTQQNILVLDFKKNLYFDISIICLVLTIMSAGPLWMLPLKDTWEDIFNEDEIMTDSQNISVTLILTGIWFLSAILIPSIGDVLSILGLTWNPFIGFFLPVLWYLKLEKNSSILMKFWSILILLLTFSFSVWGMYDYVLSKIS